jgi:phosphatidylinositol glycan class W
MDPIFSRQGIFDSYHRLLLGCGMEGSKREAHISHVSHLTGGEWHDICLLALIPYVAMVVYVAYVFMAPRKVLGGWVDAFAVVSLPITALLTVFSSEIAIAVAVALSLIGNVGFSLFSSRTRAWEDTNRFHFTFFNAAMMLATVLSILAVDFHVFPRRFAKRETFGFSLMDMGVGAFVFKSGFLSKASRGWSKETVRSGKHVNPLLHAVRTSYPLFLFGIFRLALVKFFDYQEHVSEYGHHWNFFLTLFFVRVFASFLFASIPSFSATSYLTLGLLLITGYQIILSNGLTSFLELEERNTLFEMNKEGVVSLLGYFSLYSSAVFFGHLYFQRTRLSVPFTLLCWGALTLVFWGLAYTSHHAIQMASRRFVNFTYFWLVHAFFSTSLFACYSLQMSCSFVSFPKNNSFLDSVNSASLLIFLVGNLLTGAVNLCFDTLAMSDVKAFGVLFGYLSLACGIGSMASWLASE